MVNKTPAIGVISTYQFICLGVYLFGGRPYLLKMLFEFDVTNQPSDKLNRRFRLSGQKFDRLGLPDYCTTKICPDDCINSSG